MPLLVGLVVFELAVMVLSICLHDCAQAWAANRLGDPTAKLAGRLTMNPVPHFDLFGMVVWPLLYIFRSPLVLGWGKPVPMIYRNFRDKNSEVKAVLAGPAAQLAAAVVALLILLVLKHTIHSGPFLLLIVELMAGRAPVGANGLPTIFPLLLLLYLCLMVNLLLFVFNLLPLPYLDGGKILVHFLPYNAAKKYEQYSLYIMLVFFFVGFYLIIFIFGPLFSVFNTLLNRL